MATSEFGRSESGGETEMLAVSSTGNFQAATLRAESDAIQRLMPWILSVMLHLGVLVIMMFIGFILIPPVVKPVIAMEPPVMQDPLDPQGPTMDNSYIAPPAPTPGEANRGAKGVSSRNPWRLPTEMIEDARRESASPAVIAAPNSDSFTVYSGRNDKSGIFSNAVAGAGIAGPNHGPGGGDGTDGIGLATGGGVFGDIVFVIDRSGSMSETFDELKTEMLRAISHLDEKNMFHVIMFSSGSPIENGPKRLVPADESYKRGVARFLRETICSGQTDPLPAIRRAFEVANAAGDKRRTVICLLTDGAFPDNHRVVELISELNRDKRVHVFTYLYGEPDEATASIMKQIAQKNNGRYKYVSPR